MKKLLYILTALAVAGCTDDGHFTPAGSGALFSYTFAYDSALGSSQATNTKELYHVDGSTVALSLEQDQDQSTKTLYDAFYLLVKANRTECRIAQLEGEYASLNDVKLSDIDDIEYEDNDYDEDDKVFFSYLSIDTTTDDDLVSEETDEETGVTVETFVSTAHPVFVVHCSADEEDSDHFGFVLRVVSVSKNIITDPAGKEVPPSTPFGEPTYKETTDYQVSLAVEYKAFNKHGWM